MKFIHKSLIAVPQCKKLFGNIDLHFGIKESSIDFFCPEMCAQMPYFSVSIFFKNDILCEFEFNNVSYEDSFSTVFFPKVNLRNLLTHTLLFWHFLKT